MNTSDTDIFLKKSEKRIRLLKKYKIRQKRQCDIVIQILEHDQKDLDSSYHKP